MSRTLIAGCGDVGSALASRLVEAGGEVWGLKRSPGGLPEGVRALLCDLTRPMEPGALPTDLDQVVFLPTPGQRDEDGYRRIFVTGLNNLLRALERGDHSIRRFVFVSSTSVYEQSGGERVDERSRTQPGRFSGRVLLEAESRLAATGYSSVAIRFGGIYGPGRVRLIERVRSGAACRATPPHYTNRIHRDDCARALQHLLSLKSPAPVYIGVDNDPAMECEVMDFIAERLGVERPPRSPSDSAQAATGKRCQNALLIGSGFEVAYPSYREGYAELVAGPA